MIEPLENMPEGVVGFEAVGEVQKSDYEDVLLPAIADAIASHGKLRFVYLVGDRFEGYSGGAAWEDTKLGFEHLTDFERVAMVSDVDWMRHLAGAIGWMMPGKFKVFRVAELENAKAWAAASD